MKLTNQKRTTSWGSKNAEDLFEIAIKVAGFTAPELMLEIHRASPNSTKTNETMVGNAMDRIMARNR